MPFQLMACHDKIANAVYHELLQHLMQKMNMVLLMTDQILCYSGIKTILMRLYRGLNLHCGCIATSEALKLD